MQSYFLLPGPFRFGNSGYSKNVSKSEVGILSGIRFIVCVRVSMILLVVISIYLLRP